MTPDDLAVLGLGLGAVALLGIALARRTGLPDPVVLVVVGVLAGLLPGVPVVELPPDVVFLVFLPPLLYAASFRTSPQTLRENAVGVGLLAVGLVLATALLVAVTVSALVPGLTLATGLVLGAALGPTDPVAAAAVFRRLGAPPRVVALVEGESLVNDATALVLYAVAVQAVLEGPPTAWEALGRLALAVAGGVAAGALVAAVVVAARRRLADVGLQLLLSLLTPYAAYLLADRVEASGVLAVVTTGLVLGSRDGGVFGPRVRLQAQAFWSLLDVLLNAVLFVLLGLEVRGLLVDAPDVGAARLALYGAAVVGVVVATRLAWQFVVPPPVYALRERLGSEAVRSTASERLLLGWTGMRGAISLAAVLAVPLQARGGPFPDRPLLVYLTVCVVLVTLVAQGLTLPLLLSRLGVVGDGHTREEERRTRLALADVALARLEELEGSGRVSSDAVAPLRLVWEQARTRALPDRPDPDAAEDLVGLRLELAERQGEELDRRRRAGEVPADVARRLREELDLQQVRLSRRGA